MSHGRILPDRCVPIPAPTAIDRGRSARGYVPSFSAKLGGGCALLSLRTFYVISPGIHFTICVGSIVGIINHVWSRSPGIGRMILGWMIQGTQQPGDVSSGGHNIIGTANTYDGTSQNYRSGDTSVGDTLTLHRRISGMLGVRGSSAHHVVLAAINFLLNSTRDTFWRYKADGIASALFPKDCVARFS